MPEFEDLDRFLERTPDGRFKVVPVAPHRAAVRDYTPQRHAQRDSQRREALPVPEAEGVVRIDPRDLEREFRAADHGTAFQHSGWSGGWKEFRGWLGEIWTAWQIARHRRPDADDHEAEDADSASPEGESRTNAREGNRRHHKHGHHGKRRPANPQDPKGHGPRPPREPRGPTPPSSPKPDLRREPGQTPRRPEGENPPPHAREKSSSSTPPESAR